MPDNEQAGEWWKALPMRDRDRMAMAFTSLSQLPDVLSQSAEHTRGKEGSEDGYPEEARYARGLAGGMDIAIGMLRKALADLDKVTPRCPHGKPLLATCVDGDCCL